MERPVERPGDQRPEDQPPGNPAESRRRDPAHRVAASGVTAALALGLRQVLDPQPVDTVGIEQEAPTKPVDRDRLELRFDPLSSANTIVVVRCSDDS